MWLTLLKTLLIVWLAIGLTVIVIVGVRRSRANRGSMPATPLPEWVDRDDENPEPGSEKPTG
jgi:hypothetical protein